MTAGEPVNRIPHNRSSRLNVDPQSGKIRLGLTLIGFFILWSILAVIASYRNPLGSLPSLFGMPSTQTMNQSTNVLEEIVADYFSAFALLNLVIFILIALIGYRQVRAILSSTLHLSQAQIAGRYLRNCAFSAPAPIEIQPSMDSSSLSDEQKVFSSLGGPCYLHIDPQFTALVQDDCGKISLIQADSSENAYLIEYREKLLGLYPSQEKELHLNIAATCGDGKRIRLKDICVHISSPIHQYESSEGTFSETGETPKFEGSNWEDFTIENLQLEIRDFFLRHNSQDIRRQIEPATGNEPPRKSIDRIVGRRHTMGHHPDISVYYLSGNIAHKPNAGFNIRNRRHSLMPEFHKDTLHPETPVPPADNLQDEMQQYLSQTSKVIYNNAIINPKIIDIGEISFNEIH